jgi:hypothetical protein
MLFRQLFERESSTYTFLIAPHAGGEALLIDPVKTEVWTYGSSSPSTRTCMPTTSRP